MLLLGVPLRGDSFSYTTFSYKLSLENNPGHTRTAVEKGGLMPSLASTSFLFKFPKFSFRSGYFDIYVFTYLRD